MGKLLSDQRGKELTNINAIIGQSGAGKSTLADAFGFLADCLDKGVEIACDLNGRGGFEKLISQGESGTIEFELYYRETSNTSPITYELSISLDKTGRPIVEKERLRQRRANERHGRPLSFLYLEKGKGFAFKGDNSGVYEENDSEFGEKVNVELADPRQLGIVTLGELKEHPRIVKFKNFLKNWYLCYFSPSAAREIPNAGPQKYLNRLGNNLNNVAEFLQREDPSEFKKVLKDIQTKLPGIARIEPVKLINGQLVLEFLEEGFTKPFYSQKMSDGTLKLFAYYLLLHEKQPRPLVFIEEPENGLYHKYLADLANEMRKSVKSGYSKQLFITTHSPFFVNALEPNEVWVLEKHEDGFSTIKRASDYENVKELREQGVDLGDLWYSDYFG
ncbi:AAA family ATPase [Sporolactobacillus sp. CPB3-1]|uniref:AAA family ATPase n=2 Tax=Sporolactobacillus mangiferae TaxID=2940498 RepID=A0ABT0MBR5_9BACL|nr:AAA family ATPase [Sporolactobacillus mangiferae]